MHEKQALLNFPGFLELIFTIAKNENAKINEEFLKDFQISSKLSSSRTFQRYFKKIFKRLPDIAKKTLEAMKIIQELGGINYTFYHWNNYCSLFLI